MNMYIYVLLDIPFMYMYTYACIYKRGCISKRVNLCIYMYVHVYVNI